MLVDIFGEQYFGVSCSASFANVHIISARLVHLIMSFSSGFVLLHHTHTAFAKLFEDLVVGNDWRDQGSLLYCDLRSVQPTGRTPLEETSVVGLRK
jgi:hypothetical protein